MALSIGRFFLILMFVSFCRESAHAQGVPARGVLETERKMIRDEAHRLDLLEDYNLEILDPKERGLQHPLGTIFEQSCLEKPNQWRQAFKDENALHAVDQALGQVLRCRERYPEMTTWIHAWIASVRRHRISCSTEEQKIAKKDKDSAVGTVTSAVDYGNNRMTIFSPLRNSLFFPYPLKNGNGLYTYPSDINAFVHEVAHSTSIDNQPHYIHNDLQKEGLPKKVSEGLCERNVLDDRTIVFSSLCAPGGSLEPKNQHTERVLYDRMMQCGPNFCIKLFTRSLADNDTEESLLYYLLRPKSAEQVPDSTPALSVAKARSLCMRIEEQGYCQHLKETQGRVIFAARPEVQVMVRKLRERLSALYPSDANELPSGLIAATHGATEQIQELSTDRCFQNLFRVTPKGALFLLPHEKELRPGTMSVAMKLEGHLLYLRNRLNKRLDEEPACASLDSRFKVGMLVDLVRNEVRKLKGDEKRAAGFRSLEKLGKIAWGQADDDSLGVFENMSPMVSQFVGEDVLRELGSVLQRFHWRSTEFDCKAAGLKLPKSMFATREKKR